MENIQNFAPFLRNFFHFKLLESSHDSSNNQNNWKNKLKILKNTLIFPLHFVNYSTYLSLIIYELLSPSITIERASVLICILMMCIRILFCYSAINKNREKILKIKDKLPKTYEKSEEEKFSVSRRLRNCRLPGLFGTLSPSFSMIQFVSVHGLVETRRTLIQTEFSFIQQNWLLYGIYNMYPNIMTNFITVLELVNGNILYGIIVVLTVEFQKLSLEIQEIHAQIADYGKKKEKSSSKIKKNPDLVQKLDTFSTEISQKVKEVIEKHRHLLDIRDELENVFAPSFLVNFICGLISISMIEFYAITNENLVLIITMGFCTLILVAIFFIQCYYCQQLKDACLAVSDVIYECKWEELADIEVKKQIKMILMRSQKSKTLSCWKFTENSYGLFGSVSN